MLVPCKNNRPDQPSQRLCRKTIKNELEYAADELLLIRRTLEAKCNEELIERTNNLKSIMVNSFLATLE